MQSLDNYSFEEKIDYFQKKYNLNYLWTSFSRSGWKFFSLKIPIVLFLSPYINFIIILSFLLMLTAFLVSPIWLMNQDVFNSTVNQWFYPQIVMASILTLIIEVRKQQYKLYSWLWFDNTKAWSLDKDSFIDDERSKIIIIILIIISFSVFSIVYDDFLPIGSLLIVMGFWINAILKTILYNNIKQWKKISVEQIVFHIRDSESNILTQMTNGKINKFYYLYVEYSYSVKGKKYMSSQVYIDAENRKNLFQATEKYNIYQWINDHQEHKHAYYNPDSPFQAVLFRDVETMSHIQNFFVALISSVLPFAIVYL